MHDLQTIIAMNAERPPVPTRKPTADLDTWAIMNKGSAMIVRGIIYNDEAKRFPDGSQIISSRVVSVDTFNMKVETRNTTYNLINN